MSGSYGSKGTPVGLLNAEKKAEAGLLVVFWKACTERRRTFLAWRVCFQQGYPDKYFDISQFPQVFLSEPGVPVGCAGRRPGCLQGGRRHRPRHRAPRGRQHRGQARIQPMRFDTEGFLIDSLICER